MKQDEQLTLKDGRQLAYTVHGDPDGWPIVFFHGNPGSRYMRHPDETLTIRAGAKLITPDRPGYGKSDFQPKRTLLHMADDITQLMDALKIDEFSLMGVSAGGPYVAATAYQLPERVRSGAIISGAAPFDRPNALDDIGESYRQAYKVAKWPGWVLRPLMAAQMRSESANPERAWAEVLARAVEYDETVLSRPEVAEQVKAYRTEATQQGVRGWVHEAKLLVKRWGFPVNHVRQPIHLWYWQHDVVVPQQMGRFLEMALSNAIPHFMPNGGHFAFFDHWADILQGIINVVEI
jgi:pimeloyl-ACP methyl ester carboxylesterase